MQRTRSRLASDVNVRCKRQEAPPNERCILGVLNYGLSGTCDLLCKAPGDGEELVEPVEAVVLDLDLKVARGCRGKIYDPNVSTGETLF